MIDLAARATNGVNIPGRKATRGEIKRTFKDHLRNLKARLNVGTTLTQISYLCLLTPSTCSV